MNKDITEILDFFSDLTQRTLSLFHLSGVEDDSNLDMNELVRLVKNNVNRKLVTSVPTPDGLKYVRFFNDGYTDTVLFSELKGASTFTFSEENIKIYNILKREHVPILSFKLSDVPTLVNDKEIESPIERIFFM